MILIESEIDVLRKIEKNSTITQRDISKSTGISLGEVNALIKRLVKKGVLKIERINSRNIRYLLTPSGIRNITENTYRYVVASYKLIRDIEARVDLVLDRDNVREVALLGTKDEIFELLEDKLRERGVRYEHVDQVENIKEEALILVWQPDFVEAIRDVVSIEIVNLLI